MILAARSPKYNPIAVPNAAPSRIKQVITPPIRVALRYAPSCLQRLLNHSDGSLLNRVGIIATRRDHPVGKVAGALVAD
jgi:hypothetical protein